MVGVLVVLGVPQFQKRHCSKQHRLMNIVILQCLVKYDVPFSCALYEEVWAV